MRGNSPYSLSSYQPISPTSKPKTNETYRDVSPGRVQATLRFKEEEGRQSVEKVGGISTKSMISANRKYLEGQKEKIEKEECKQKKDKFEITEPQLKSEFGRKVYQDKNKGSETVLKPKGSDRSPTFRHLLS